MQVEAITSYVNSRDYGSSLGSPVPRILLQMRLTLTILLLLLLITDIRLLVIELPFIIHLNLNLPNAVTSLQAFSSFYFNGPLNMSTRKLGYAINFGADVVALPYSWIELKSRACLVFNLFPGITNKAFMCPTATAGCFPLPGLASPFSASVFILCTMETEVAGVMQKNFHPAIHEYGFSIEQSLSIMHITHRFDAYHPPGRRRPVRQHRHQIA
ncbi:hypothetical protein PT974_06947 [Cladobotryum mycophilum]|uniref:Uncharacterized protein n=1 Tax=Cladobotryum mycophilum TaxID=491253 RepID=A0ABR0SP36_9HYPO